MYRHILVPVDFSEKNFVALETAGRLALPGGSMVTLLHVIEKVNHIGQQELKNFYSRLEDSAKEKMGHFLQYLSHVPAVEQEIVYGKRAEEIVRFAMEKSVDLIVVSSHKVSPEAGWGTLSYKIGILSQCSVLLVK